MVIKKNSGSATIEYAILMPIIFACVFAAIIVMMILYQKTLIQNIAEDAAQGLSRQWGYNPLPVDEMESGVYKRKAYDDRETYWNINFLSNSGKIEKAEEYLSEKLKGIGLLNEYDSVDGVNTGKPVKVSYASGLPSTLTVDIKAAYKVPGAGLMKLLGMGDYLIIEGHGTAAVYDAKDMINTTDFVLQMMMSTQAYQKFIEKIGTIKENLNKLMKK